MIKSKIHPFAVVFTIVTILLSIPSFMLAIGVVDDYAKSPANIFFVIMLFFGLMAITLFIFGWRNLKQLKISEKNIEEKWLGRWVIKKIYLNENTKYRQNNFNYGFFKINRTIIEDEKGQQIHYNNLDFRNTKQLNEYLRLHTKEHSVKIKMDTINKIFITLFVIASIYMVVTGNLKMIF